MTFDSENGRAARQIVADKARRESAERKAAYLERTPKVLLDAQRAAFTREGCTPAQKRLIDNWWRSRLYDTELSRLELLAAAVAAKGERRRVS